MEDKTLERTMLLDFYGELLTPRQRDCYDLYYNDDLSLGEIAALQGVSRQAVRDSLVRAESALREYEAKTGLLGRFSALRRQATVLAQKAERLTALLPEGEARGLSREIRDELEELKR